MLSLRKSLINIFIQLSCVLKHNQQSAFNLRPNTLQWNKMPFVDFRFCMDWTNKIQSVVQSQYPVVTRCNIKDGKKGQPNYAGSVHCESDKLGLIEVFWALPGLEGIPMGRITFLIRQTHWKMLLWKTALELKVKELHFSMPEHRSKVQRWKHWSS